MTPPKRRAVASRANDARLELIVEEPRWRKADPRLPARLRRAALAALARAADARVCKDLTILLTNDTKLRSLNAGFRGKNAPTNVLAFPAAAGDSYLGDVAIAYGVAAAEAMSTGKSLGDHATHLVVHGVLHLLGYDHQKAREAQTMEALEVEILATLGVADPYAARKHAAA
jgi:probable rRNA maturation factor